MIKEVETGVEKGKAYDLICQLHSALSHPILTRDEYDRRLSLAKENGYSQYIFIQDNKISGLIGIRILNDLLRPKRLFIDDLVIDRDCRKKGYGTKLLDFANELASKNGCKRIDLEAALKNEAAITAYENYGMDKVAYLMKKLV